ncbi:unnamed protein product [Ranitomeya imitator]|uniref:BAR domain-containing protein n=1 Tax=Ranitomeya imitator TaxID=111125 RepID=A0ABN9MPX1_9NEOB|nr:unnamed protein product [Ranitomeya imitator]
MSHGLRARQLLPVVSSHMVPLITVMNMRLHPYGSGVHIHNFNERYQVPVTAEQGKKLPRPKTVGHAGTAPGALGAASRAKLSMLNTVSKIRGQVKNPGYPQPEGLLGECMVRYGRELGDESKFGSALLDAGESMKRLAEVKDSLDIDVKQNFLDPMQNLADKDLKEIQHHLKKLEGRRLDYDYKKKRQGKIPDEELRQALEKFVESKEVAETSMLNLLDTDVEQVSQLSALVEAQVDYHRQAVQILEELSDKLKVSVREASSRPKREIKIKTHENYDYGETDHSNGGISCNPPNKPTGKICLLGTVNLMENCCESAAANPLRIRSQIHTVCTWPNSKAVLQLLQ